jgi:shikimate dehydrogenase
MQIDKRVTGRTRLLGVIGNPIAHSISPQLHNTISSHLGVDLVYVPLRVEKEELGTAVKGLKALNYIGFNVTVPYKKDVMKFLDENTKEAILMGAVNTVKSIDGRLYGYNTDAEGFARSFKQETGTGFKGKKIMLLGAGGTTRAIAVKIALEGAQKLAIVNRTLTKADEIADMINNNFRPITTALSPEEEKTARAFSESDIIINTTSAGMHPNVDDTPLTGGMQFQAHQIVYDVVYNPGKTKFLEEADGKGCKISNGLGMLFYQGISAYEIWTGIKLPDKLVKEIYVSFTEIIAT